MVQANQPRGPTGHAPRPRKVVMPDVTGLPLADARVVIQAAGFAGANHQPVVQVRYVEAYAPDFQVTAQQPIRGQMVDASTAIELQIARQGWARFLPQLYQSGQEENALLQQFLWIFQQLHDKTTHAIEHVPELLRPLDTDRAFLPWLAAWMALHVEADWEEAKVRKWLRVAPALYSIRGTKRALTTLLDMHLGYAPEIEENTWPFEPFRVGVASTIGVSSTILPPLNLAHCFVVRLPVAASALSQDQIVRIHRVIQAEKPAHTLYYLAFAEAQTADDALPFLTIGEDPGAL